MTFVIEDETLHYRAMLFFVPVPHVMFEQHLPTIRNETAFLVLAWIAKEPKEEEMEAYTIYSDMYSLPIWQGERGKNKR